MRLTLRERYKRQLRFDSKALAVGLAIFALICYILIGGVGFFMSISLLVTSVDRIWLVLPVGFAAFLWFWLMWPVFAWLTDRADDFIEGRR